MEAKAKGIPVYVFINKNIQTILPLWKKNKGMDFSDMVQDVKVLDFVEELYKANNHWIYNFENAQDIIDTLRKQFSYLFMEALTQRQNS